ncbi:MAG TPA: alpha amylase C-terminal domain-containing protein [Polyangiaceae bacterium]
MRSIVWLALACVACGAEPPQPAPAPASNSVRAEELAHGKRSMPLPAPAFGANVTSSGIVFRVWAPHASAAWVVGDFAEQKVAMTAEGAGIFSATVADAHAGTNYSFTFDSPAGTIHRLDPYCRQVLDDASACTVVDPSAYVWQSGAFARAPRNATVVYEAHVAGFAGTLAAMRAALPSLATLGANVIELMPVQSYGGKASGWGYNPQLYFAPKAGLGTSDDLRGLVDEAHHDGMGVWIDTVVNHMDGWSQAPLACFDGDCPSGSHGPFFFPPGAYATTPWGPRPNYAEPRVAEMLLASVSAWLGEYRGDGMRWDSVSNVRGIDGQGTVPGGRDLLVAANDLAHAAGATSVAEDLKGYAAITQAPKDGGFGFDAQWDGFGYAVTGVLATATDAGRDLGAIQSALTGSYAGDPFARLIFVEDHDTVGNGGARLPSKIDPTTPTSFWARRRSMLGGVLLLTAPGVPMIFMGQESLATGTFTNPPAPLASTIPAGFGDKMRAFYTDMIALRRNVGGQSGGLLDTNVEILQRNDTNKVIAYRRWGASGEDVIVVVNLMNKAYTEYDVGVPSGGDWRVRLDTDWMKYGDDFGGGATGAVTAVAANKDGQPYALPVKLGAYAAVVFSR